MNKIIHFTLNGDPVEALAPVNMTMVDFLRKEMHLTGTKRGCEEGECGACTILLDGRAGSFLHHAGKGGRRPRDNHHRGRAQKRRAASRTAGVHG